MRNDLKHKLRLGYRGFKINRAILFNIVSDWLFE
jgi:hypothetical protein